MDNRKIFVNILSLTPFVFLTLILIIIARTPSAIGYEFSMYSAFHWIFWLLVFLIIILGYLLIFLTCFSSTWDRFRNGFIVILATTFILTLLPYLRGYVFYGRGDVLTHIGFINNIVENSHIGNNFYPSFHIFSAIIHQYTELSLHTVVTGVIPPVIICFFIVSIYLLAKELFDKKNEIVLFVIFSSLPIFPAVLYSFHPSSLTFLFLPLALWAYLKWNRNRSLSFLLLLILTIFIPFSHPSTLVFTVLIFFILIVAKIMRMVQKENRPISISLLWQKMKDIWVVTILPAILFLIWYLTFPRFRNVLTRQLNAIIKKGGQSQKYTSITESTQIQILDVIKWVIARYGEQLILIIIFFIFVLFLYKYREKISLRFYNIFYLVGSILFIFLTAVIFFVTGLQWWRIFKYAIFFMTGFVGINLGIFLKYVQRHSIKKIFSFSVVLILVCSMLSFSLANFYFSPTSYSLNMQISEQEISGMQWFFSNRNRSILIQELMVSQKRFHDAFYGVGATGKSIRWGVETGIPDHFGYYKIDLFGQLFEGNRYLIFSKPARGFYPRIFPSYPQYWKFNNKDFVVLENDSSVSKIYDDGDFNTYLVFGRK